jgi:CubicO group peptidase (beta-lactamase class C family)
MPLADAQVLPYRNGTPYIPDTILLAERTSPWSYAIAPSPSPVALTRSVPSAGEARVIERAKELLAVHEAKAIALVDGRDVIHVEFKAPASETSLFFSASMAKTVTSMVVGQTVCAGKLRLEDRADALVPELGGKALGKATIRDLLRMSAGTAEPDNPTCPSCGNIFTADDWKRWNAGTLDLVNVLTRDDVARAGTNFLVDLQPGERFVYKATDPLLLGIIVSRATGMPYARWAQRTVFNPMGTAQPGRMLQNKMQQVMSDTGVRLHIQDWIRFAWWVRQAARSDGCFGDYVRQATRTQIANGTSPKARRTGGFFGGYGYLVWTDNQLVPASYWAAGYGGQRIGWNRENDRMIVVFSNQEDWMPEVYALYRDWAAASR